MQKEFLTNILAQNIMTTSFSLNRVSGENAGLRLNSQCASAGFIFRHIAETMHLFTTFLGMTTDVKNTTMGSTDTGQGSDVEESRRLISKGFQLLEQIIATMPDEDWLQMIDTPFFGSVTRLRLFSHILFHNSHHAGQIALTLQRGVLTE
ncbi:MAG TPA: DinB family protein [Chitinophagaceae bacterium]|nr:DinB family protein [Chitinophagaceae bacterium]